MTARSTQRPSLCVHLGHACCSVYQPNRPRSSVGPIEIRPRSRLQVRLMGIPGSDSSTTPHWQPRQGTLNTRPFPRDPSANPRSTCPCVHPAFGPFLIPGGTRRDMQDRRGRLARWCPGPLFPVTQIRRSRHQIGLVQRQTSHIVAAGAASWLAAWHILRIACLHAPREPSGACV